MSIAPHLKGYFLLDDDGTEGLSAGLELLQEFRT
jgi:hypothetical protein